MNSNRNPGPFLRRFFIPEQKIEAIAKRSLEFLDLMPSSPGPVKIEKYCERRWKFTEDYRELETGVLGQAAFTENGVVEITVSSDLAEDTSRAGLVRSRSTLAHEIGHGELHAIAFAEKIRHDRVHKNIFDQCSETDAIKIACRGRQIQGPRSDEWWEIQANLFMVAVLLPKHLLRQVVEDWMPQKRDGSFRPPTYLLDEEIAEIFEVSREMGRIAGDKMRQLIVDERNQIEMLFGNMQ
jgi:hypothetical protein